MINEKVKFDGNHNGYLFYLPKAFVVAFNQIFNEINSANKLQEIFDGRETRTQIAIRLYYSIIWVNAISRSRIICCVYPNPKMGNNNK